MLKYINPLKPDEEIICIPATQNKNGLISKLDKLKLDNVIYSSSNIILTDFSNGGLIEYFDTTYSIQINQITPSQILFLNNPIDNNNRYILLTNIGNTSFTIYNKLLNPNETNMYIWNNIEWKLISTTYYDMLSSFHIIDVTTDYSITNWNSIINVDTLNNDIVITLPNILISDQGKRIIINKVGSLDGSITIKYGTEILTTKLYFLYNSIVYSSTLEGPVLIISNTDVDGLVPKPLTGSQNLFLRGDATWNPPLLEVKNISSNTILEANIEYHVDSSSTSLILTLPTTVSNGSIIRLVDSTNSWSTNNITINNVITLTNQKIFELYYNTSNDKWINKQQTYDITYLGEWNASTNIPIIYSSSGITNSYYKVSMPGNSNIDDNINWRIGEIIFFNGQKWNKLMSELYLPNGYIYIGNSFDVLNTVMPSGDVTISNTGISVIKDSVNLDGNPTLSNNPIIGDNSNNIATTSFVQLSKILTSLVITNQISNGILGSLNDINNYDKYVVNQTTDNIFFTLPNPTNTKFLYILNNGNVAFGVYKKFIKPFQYIVIYYNGNGWIEWSDTRSFVYINTSMSLYNDMDYFVNTSNNSITLTLPSSSYNGSIINIIEDDNCWNKNPVIINGMIDTYNQIVINSGRMLHMRYNTNSSRWLSNNESQIIPNMRMSNYSKSGLDNYLSKFVRRNKNIDWNVRRYVHGMSGLIQYAYAGNVYSPTQNRIYFVPHNQATQTNWHYVDCNTGNVIAYTHGVTAVSNGYAGNVYSPTQNRIYFVPYNQATQTNWHYVDCNTGNIVAYTHGVSGTVLNAYTGGVYSPTQNRIYFVPDKQTTQTNWHYVDCNTGNIVAYTHGVTVVSGGYFGGVYSPTQNRIYFVPYGQSNQTSWHYVDCDTGNIVAYTHGATVVSNGYLGGVYSPTQNRIYFIPSTQPNQTNWHYVDCNTGNIVAYNHGISGLLEYAYIGGVYSPVQNRIYFVPHNQATQTNWHYVDCNTGNVVAYNHGISGTVVNAYFGGVYSPTQNRIYFAPSNQATQTNWHYVDIMSLDRVSNSLMSGAMFNKF